MSDVVAYSGPTQILASATLSGAQLNWDTLPVTWLSQCVGLQVQASKVWIVVSGNVTLDQNGFPQFQIDTPFFSAPGSGLSLENGTWTLELQLFYDPGQPIKKIHLNSGSPGPAPVTFTVTAPAFNTLPRVFSLGVNQGQNVTIDFPKDKNSGTLVPRFTADANGDGDFWKPYPSPTNYEASFSYLLGESSFQPYIEVTGLPSDQLLAGWNEVAATYLAAVRSTEPDAPLSAAMVLFPSSLGNSPGWIYRGTVQVSVDPTGSTGSRTVTWNQGFFTYAGTCQFEALDFLVHSGKALLLNCIMQYPDSIPTSVPAVSSGPTAVFVFQFETMTYGGVQSVRIGALDLTFSTGGSPSNVSTGQMVGYLELPGNLLSPVPRVRISDLQLEVAVQVGSQDALPAGTMPGTPDVPVVVASLSAVSCVLGISENNFPASPPQPRSVNLSLSNQSTSGGNPVSLLILDRTPFLVARVNLPSLLGSGNASGAVVAQWSNAFEGGGWQSQSGVQAITVLLPPQGIGEAMERGRDIGPAHIDYRFSPCAQVQLTPPLILDQDAAYYEAPWNLRRLLATPGQDVPGALLPSFSAEFLYGMGVSVQSPQLRLTEISSLTGRLAPPVPDPQIPSTVYSNYQAYWSNVLDTFQTRLAALVPWDGVQANTLSLTNGTQYTLRQSADLAYPGPPPTPAGTQPFPTLPNGLKGGVGWIFETAGPYTAVWQRPQSTSALLADPVLSTLGGWAKQRAVFLNGSTVVNAHVEMGRVSTVSVEFIGRIGVLWNHAKHVVVYERTVQPSAQFQESQDLLLGRPIVRKVEEYIEILQPIRQYPESGAAIQTACVQGSEFKSKIIYIDPSWGSLVPNDPSDGWKVPLWQRGADPFVYPKPHIVLQVALDPDTGSETQNQEITEPEKLFFYQPASGGPNPDAWAAVQGVDFDDLDTSLAGSSAGAAQGDSNQAYRLSISPGLGAYTWSLAPGPFPVNVVAARTSSTSISARLKNVTMMRAMPGTRSGTQPSVQAQALNAIPDHITSLFQELSDSWKGSVAATIGSSDFASYFTYLNGALAGAFPNVPLDTQLNHLYQSASNSFQQLTNSAANYFNEVQTAIQTAAASTGSQLQEIAEQQLAILNTPIAALTANWPTGSPSVSAALQNATALLEGLINQANHLGSPAKLSDVITLQTAVAQATQTLALPLSSFQAITGTQFPAGWMYLATLESHLAGAIASGSVSNVDTSGLVSDLKELAQIVTTLASNPLTTLTLDPAANSPLSAVANAANQAAALKAANAWLTEVSTLSVQTAINKCQNNIKAWVKNTAAAWAQAGSPAPDFNGLLGKIGQLQNIMIAREAILGVDFVSQLPAFQTQIQAAINGFLEAGKLFSPPAATSYFSQGSPALSLFRAFGVPPVATGLSFALTNLPQPPPLQNLAYFFDTTLPNVPITANVQTILNQAAQSVSGILPMNLTVPVNAVLDQLVPNAKQIAGNLLTGAGGIFQNLAGMDLSALFSNIVPPVNTPDCIHITHSINQQTLQVEVNADIDIPFASDIQVFNEGPIYLRLVNAIFQATVSLQAGVGQQTVEQISGSISGDWEVQIGGLSLVTFVNTSLTFDQAGHIQFNVSPEKVRLASVLQFLADLINSFIPPGSGLSIAFDTAPVNVTCNLDLPLPDIAGGVFAISNLRLGALFGLGLDSNNHFTFNVGMNLSKMEAPFAIVVFILGGGGWIDAQLSYTPGYGPARVQVEIGISAVAELEIALGPISGGVMISFSLFAQYDSGAQSTLDVGIVIVIAGHVDLLDIVDADITLMLEADYSGGKLTGRGSLSVDIQICWCFTLSIHEEIEYSFGNAAASGSSGIQASIAPRAAGRQAMVAAPAPPAVTGSPASDPFWQAADAYITMLAA